MMLKAETCWIILIFLNVKHDGVVLNGESLNQSMINTTKKLAKI